ncbi:M4 family metallopeptidase [bacterium]|nr:M4 family metallopeptidase [bacterium]
MKNVKYSLRILTGVLFFLAAASFINTTISWSIPPAGLLPSAQVTAGNHNRPDQSTLMSISLRLKSIINPASRHAKTVPSAVSLAQSGGMPYYRNESDGTPVFMTGDTVTALKKSMGKIVPGTALSDIALQFLSSGSDVFKLDNPQDELRLGSETVSQDGSHHIGFDQYYQGIPLWGHRLVVHFDKDGEPYALNARYSPTPQNLDTSNVPYDMKSAVDKATADLSLTTSKQELDDIFRSLYSYDGPTAELVILSDRENPDPRLVWHVTIRPNMKDMWYYFIDARNGDIVEKYNTAVSYAADQASGKDALGVNRNFNVSNDSGVYYMIDTDANIYTYDAQGKVLNSKHSAVLVSSPNNTWPDSIAVSAHSNVWAVYEYYLEKHNRKGVDGNGIKLPVFIHYTEDGKPMYNAFWGGEFMAFGDGDIFAAALDVVAHELTHAVVQYTVGLEYKYQSGALNEGIADAMAAMVDPDWEIGEDLKMGAIRDLKNPERFGLPATMGGYQSLPLSEDNGGVHINMSIPSRACELTAEVIGRDETAQILYGVLNKMYLTPQAQFIDMRLGAIQSATDLFGADSPEVAAVAQAFDTVGILNDQPTKPPADIPPPTGDTWVAFVLQNQLKLGKSVLASQSDIYSPSQTTLYDQSSSPVTVSHDGTFLLFVDSSNNIRHVDLATFKETVIDSSGVWRSIALSPDNAHLALTTTAQDNTVCFINIVNSQDCKTDTLYTASTEGANTNTVVYADMIEWNHDGTQLLYDALHSVPVTDGNPVEFWDVNLLDVDSGVITRVKTPTESGIQVGNPSFAETNDRYIVCDMFSEDTNVSMIVAIDLFNLQISQLSNTGMIRTSQGSYPNLGHPRYSPDDTSVMFQHYDSFYRAYVLEQLSLDTDKMTPIGNTQAYYYGELPVWLVRNQPTVVEEENELPSPGILLQNTPNPFNPVTTIPYTVSEPGLVSLTVYDLLGQNVATLVNGYSPAGSFTATFDGRGLASGIYLYLLKIGDYSMTKKMTLVK